MFTKYNLFVLCCLILLMKFKEAATSNDTSPPIETSETDKSITNMTSIISTSNVKPRFVEKEKLSSEGQMKINKKNITTGTLISLLTSNQSSYTTRTAVTSRENMSKKVESSNIGEENKPEEHDFKSMKPVEPKMADTRKSEEPNENKSMKPVEPKMADTRKSEEPKENKSTKPVEPRNSDENRSVETLEDRSKHSGNSNTGENKKSEEPSENKPIKTTEINSDEKKNPKEQLDDKSKENTKSKAVEETKTKQSQTNINDKFVGSRTSTQSLSGNDKSENNKNTAVLNEPKDIIHEQSKDNNRNQSDIVESSNSHFMVIIFIGLLFTIVAYVVFQKRKKIIAYVIEGRRRNSRDRRTSGSKDTKVSYKPLDTEDKEAGINNYKYVY